MTMKVKKIKIFLVCLVSALFFSACANDDAVITNTQSINIKPAKQADINVYSAGNSLTTLAMATKEVVTSVGTFQYYKYNWYGDTQLPEKYRIQSLVPASSISTDEQTFVRDYIDAHSTDESVKFYNIDYFIQYAGSSYKQYSSPTLKDQNGASHNVVGSSQIDYIEINDNHIKDYNVGYGPNALCLNLPVINPAFHDSYGDINQTKYNSYKIFKINYQGKDAYYLGFDYKTKKDDGEYFDGDGIYDDYVVKLTPADDITYGNDPTPVPSYTNGGEVEVNLSVNAEKSIGDYIATKLSIHVRDTTDVEVFIPVPAEYYCAADDMNIVLSHKDNAEIYNANNSETVNYVIDSQPITLTITYELGGIRVKTSGINAKVLQYLNTKYGDGITFEVWNYFKSNITRETLKNTYLNNSTITFTNDTKAYINAFGTVNDAINEWDCTVSPTNTQYTIKETNKYNKIYKK